MHNNNKNEARYARTWDHTLFFVCVFLREKKPGGVYMYAMETNTIFFITLSIRSGQHAV